MNRLLNGSVVLVGLAVIGVMASMGLTKGAHFVKAAGKCVCAPTHRNELLIDESPESRAMLSRLNDSLRHVTVVFKGTSKEARELPDASKIAMTIDPSGVRSKQLGIDDLPAVVLTRGKEKTVFGNGKMITAVDLKTIKQSVREKVKQEL